MPGPALAPAPLPGLTLPPPRPRPTPLPGTVLPVQALAAVLADARAFYENGKGNGETTHWACLDEYWTWLRKEITCITGYANQGKSRFIQSVMLIKAAIDDWKFLVYVPENEEDFYVEMAEMLVGCTANHKFPTRRMSWEQLETAVAWMHEHFTVVTAPEGVTPAVLLENFATHQGQTKYDGFLIDPWNQLTHDFQAREDLYLSQQFSLLKRFAIKHDLAVLVTAHPAGQIKDKTGKLMVPDAYSISGGKMWANKFDNVMAVFRPNFPDPGVEMWIHKIKKQGRVGKPGLLELKYSTYTNRYTPTLGDRPHPLAAISFNAPGLPPPLHGMPVSTFDAPRPAPDPTLAPPF